MLLILLLLCRLFLLGITAQVPSFDDPALCSIHVVLLLDLFDTDAHAVLGEDDVLAAHLFRSFFANFGDGEIDLVAYPGEAGDEGKGDD